MLPSITASADAHARQPQRLGDRGLLALLALLSAFIPLSTDMYLPALPTMAVTFHAPAQLVNLTLVLFFVFFSVGALLWGPLSDKYGRKPILLYGLAGYVLASAYCACTGNVYGLIGGRVLQAFSGGAAPAIAIALVKDLFSGRKRERGLVLIQSMVMIAPIVAPVIGALLLKWTSWRGVFWTLAGAGMLALLLSLALRETVVTRYRGTVLQTVAQLGVVLKNPGFSTLLLVFSLAGMPLFSYLAASSFIYIKEFHLSALTYSYYFMLNALCAVIAPFCYLQLSTRLSRRAIITLCYAVIAVSGVLICSLGQLHPWLLAFAIMPATLMMGVMRPPSTHLLLEQEHTAVGAASSLINCAGSFVGSIGMLLMSCGWRSMILPLGAVHLLAGLACGVLWLKLSRKPFVRDLPDVRAGAGVTG
ncbi:MAG TPA: Bcr/CflA family efflux MFS transporter [Armatimonadota bacterium]|jgi:DHA1 family bicyclomycin/chloramphenicol resistance-like MFS transporter